MTDLPDESPFQDETETTVVPRPEPPVLSPPVDGLELEYDGPEPVWPRVIGVISLIYAIIGLTCPTLGVAWMVFSDMLPEMMRGGMVVPTIVKITSAVSWLLTVSLGIYMISGATALLKRHRVGVGRLKRWAVLRVVLALVGVIAAVVMMPAQVEMQRQAQEWQREFLEKNGQGGMFQKKSDDQLASQVMIGTGVSVGMTLVYPLFLGFYLSRTKITAQVQTWE